MRSARPGWDGNGPRSPLSSLPTHLLVALRGSCLGERSGGVDEAKDTCLLKSEGGLPRATASRPRAVGLVVVAAKSSTPLGRWSPWHSRGRPAKLKAGPLQDRRRGSGTARRIKRERERAPQS